MGVNLERFKRLRGHEDGPILIGVMAAVAGISVALGIKGINGLRFDSYLNNFRLFALTWLLALTFIAVRMLANHRPHAPASFLKDNLLKTTFHERFKGRWLLLLAVVMFLPSFSAAKSALPLFSTYSWDPFFIRLDRFLHGDDPWRLLQPLLGYPLITSALAGLYHLWFMLIYGGSIFFAFYVNDRHLRARYFIAFFGIWCVLGIALSYTFASVGPCFVQPLLGDGHYAEQMRYLRWADTQYPVLVLEVQRMLLEWQLSGDHGLGRGITAMPSMHVGLALLFFLAVRKHSRAAAIVFGSFFVLILLGSVHLGYHYAVDGYVSIMAVMLIWWMAGKVASGLLASRSQATDHNGAPTFATAPA